MRSACAILPSVACPALQYFPHYLINGTIFEKQLLNTKCVFWFSLQILSEIFFILRRTERDIITNVYWSSLTYPLFLSHFNETWIFSTDFRKILNIKFHERPFSGSRVVPCGRTERQTDRTKVILALRKFCERAQKHNTKYDVPTFPVYDEASLGGWFQIYQKLTWDYIHDARIYRSLRCR